MALIVLVPDQEPQEGIGGPRSQLGSLPSSQRMALLATALILTPPLKLTYTLPRDTQKLTFKWNVGPFFHLIRPSPSHHPKHVDSHTPSTRFHHPHVASLNSRHPLRESGNVQVNLERSPLNEAWGLSLPISLAFKECVHHTPPHSFLNSRFSSRLLLLTHTFLLHSCFHFGIGWKHHT
jgi:hypothetical protein